MVQKLNKTYCQFERSRELEHLPISVDISSIKTYRRIKLCLVLFCIFNSGLSQEDDTKPPKVNNYKADSSFTNFNTLRFNVAKAQINFLKKDGALLVRLKTNANTIQRLKNAGNIDLATQVERETQLANKAIIRAYHKEFKFCPVYFFYSDYSDSVKHKHLENIFIDSTLSINSSIACKASFYLIAEQGSVYESSLGIVSESQAPTAIEKGTASKEVAIVVKNRYYIQLHKPFPFFQKGYSLNKYSEFVKKFNKELEEFYFKNRSFIVPDGIKQFVY